MWKNDQVSQPETLKILEMAKKCLTTPGDFVEFGCYRGDTSLMLAEVVEKPVENSVDKSVENHVEKLGKSGGKRLWLYDSFEGLPEKSDFDASEVGRDFTSGALAVSKREVKERFLRAGLKVPVIKKAWFSELLEADLPEKIAFAFIDGDFYESTRDALRLVVPKMSPQGVILVHDYNNPALPGVARAVDEFLQGQNLKTEIFETVEILKFA